MKDHAGLDTANSLKLLLLFFSLTRSPPTLEVGSFKDTISHRRPAEEHDAERKRAKNNGNAL